MNTLNAVQMEKLEGGIITFPPVPCFALAVQNDPTFIATLVLLSGTTPNELICPA